MLRKPLIGLGCLLFCGVVLASQLRFDDDRPYKPALVDDLDIAHGSRRASLGNNPVPKGRFTIVQIDDDRILLDSKTGDTWILVRGKQVKWIEIQRDAKSTVPTESSNQDQEGNPFE